MTKKLLDLSGKVDWIIPIYEAFAAAAEELNVQFFVVGATARDLIWEHGYGFKISRATHDIDFAVMIDDWDAWQRFQSVLVDAGQFEKSKASQQFLFRSNQIVDIVPFGGVETKDQTIVFPPKGESEMSVLGFAEAYSSSLNVRLRSDPPFDIRVASSPALVALKLISWKDAYPAREKDALDIAFMLRKYQDLGDPSRIYVDHPDLIETEDHDIDQAGAELLGRDIAQILREESRLFIEELLEKEIAGIKDRYRLIEDMTSGDYTGNFDENFALVEALHRGVK